jgi:hypothetical protein
MDFTDAAEGEQVNRVMDNLLTVSYQEAEYSGSQRILDGDVFNYFRSTQHDDGSRQAIYLKGTPSDLSKQEVQFINDHFDTKEGRDNKRAKRAVASSLSEHFNNQSFQVFEFGCGTKPIFHAFPDQEKVFYTGIEIDDNIIEELHSMNIPAGTYEQISAAPKQDTIPSVSVAIYSMHFMIDDDFADKIKDTISQDGFYVGNFYHTAQEQESGEQHEKLKTVLDQGDLTYRVLKQPTGNANEYWVIGKKDAEQTVDEFSKTLQKTLSANKKHPFEFKNI